MEPAGIIIVLFLGMVLGSFATALSWRMPRGISVLTKTRSECNACHYKLGLPDLVPLLSWFFLRGKCRHCGHVIGLRYPVIELATLLFCLAIYAVYGLSVETVFLFVLTPVLVSIIDIDLHHKIIPDLLNLSVFVIGGLALLANAGFAASPVNFLIEHGGEAFAGVALYGLGSLALRQGVMMALKKESMGLGDIKFFAAAGFWLGLNVQTLAWFMIVSGVSGIVISLIWKKMTGDAEAPFGPSLMAAFMGVLLFYPPSFIGI